MKGNGAEVTTEYMSLESESTRGQFRGSDWLSKIVTHLCCEQLRDISTIKRQIDLGAEGEARKCRIRRIIRISLP